MDKITIVGQDGRPKYELDQDNQLIDHCICSEKDRPSQIDGTKKICLVCNLEIKNESR